MSINFGNWQEDAEQIQRAAASRESKIKKGIMNLDRDRQFMMVQGSGKEPYHVTLNECNCVDFAMRGLPCKHMYALAFELGLMNDFPVYKGGYSHEDVQNDIDKYYDLFISGKITADSFVKLYKVFIKM